ncbi:hypothetical protein TGAM01_v209409, partial [Trichoderma gamsii]
TVPLTKQLSHVARRTPKASISHAIRVSVAVHIQMDEVKSRGSFKLSPRGIRSGILDE